MQVERRAEEIRGRGFIEDKLCELGLGEVSFMLCIPEHNKVFLNCSKKSQTCKMLTIVNVMVPSRLVVTPDLTN